MLTVQGGKTLRRQSQTNATNRHLKKFAQIVQDHRDELLREWREKVRQLPAARNLDTPTLNDHIPHLFDELTLALAAGNTESLLDLELHDPLFYLLFI